MLSSDEFAKWSADKLLFLHVTTRVDTDKYQTLLRDKGFRGFPSLAFLDAEGEVIAKHSGPRTLEGVKATSASAKKYLGLQAQPRPVMTSRKRLYSSPTWSWVTTTSAVERSDSLRLRSICRPTFSPTPRRS